MQAIFEPNVLLRVPGQLPKGLNLPTEEFHEGWNLARSIDACRLKTKIQARKWNFIKIANGLTRSGVGDTSQNAVASALRHALRRISEDSNVVEIKHIELTQYPWFFLARVGVCPYRIQQDAALPGSKDAGALPAAFSADVRRASQPSMIRVP
jgi:hypothetical protein